MNDSPSPSSPEKVEKQIVVQQPPAIAFKIWTEKIDLWWPAGHSISGDPLSKVRIEGRVDGRVYEQTSNGDEYEWGRVLIWEPAQQLSHTWYLGSGQSTPSRVDVHFVPLGPRQTRIELTHTGLDLLGELWWSRVELFTKAWGKILPLYAASTMDDLA